LFEWLGRKFPRHFGPSHVAVAERFFTRHGAWAVFFGRFIALLRIFSGPLAGSLHMPYGRFLLANASGGIIWASGLTYLIWFLGQAAAKWLSRASWIGLVAALLVGVAVTLLIRRRTTKLVEQHEAASPADETDAPAPADEAVAPAAASEEQARSIANDGQARPSAGNGQVPRFAGSGQPRPTADGDQAGPPASDGEARLAAGNGQGGPPARQRTESDR
jgi:hypothetical protein